MKHSFNLEILVYNLVLLLAAALTRHFFNSLNSAAQAFFSKLDFANTQDAYLDADSWHRAMRVGYCLNRSFALFAASISLCVSPKFSFTLVLCFQLIVIKYFYVVWAYIINGLTKYNRHDNWQARPKKDSWITSYQALLSQYFLPRLHYLSQDFALKQNLRSSLD